jgi:adenylosuccinate synthase
MKINYQEVKRLSEEMLSYVSNMEMFLDGFKKRTGAYADEMQDEISDQAIMLVETLSDEARRLREAIQNGASIVIDGAEKLNATEKRRSGEIGRI